MRKCKQVLLEERDMVKWLIMEKSMVLNELNNLKINGEEVVPELKQKYLRHFWNRWKFYEYVIKLCKICSSIRGGNIDL